MALFNSLQLSCWYFLENQISFQLSTFPLSQKWSTYSICRIESPRFSLWCFFAPVFSVGQIERAWRENFTSDFATRCCSPPPPATPHKNTLLPPLHYCIFTLPALTASVAEHWEQQLLNFGSGSTFAPFSLHFGSSPIIILSSKICFILTN